MSDVINIMSPQDALVASMIITSAADNDVSESEMREISAIIGILPAFRAYDTDRLRLVAASVIELIQDENGLDTLLRMIRDALPERLRETAYALACDVAAADGKVEPEEARLLEMMRYGLELDRLIAAGIERGSRARHQAAPSDGDAASAG